MQRVLAAGLMALVFMLVGCSGGELATPEAAVNTAIRAIKTNDVDAMKGCLSAYDRAAAGLNTDERPLRDDDGRFVVGVAQIKDHTATVPVTYKDARGKELWSSNWHCVLEDDGWKLALSRTATAFQLENFRYVQAMSVLGEAGPVFPPTWDADAVLRSAPIDTNGQPRNQPPAENSPVLETPQLMRPAD